MSTEAQRLWILYRLRQRLLAQQPLGIFTQPGGRIVKNYQETFGIDMRQTGHQSDKRQHQRDKDMRRISKKFGKGVVVILNKFQKHLHAGRMQVRITFSSNSSTP